MIPLTNVEIVLASTSPYRRELLARLGVIARQQAPRVDETPATDEGPAELAVRLARAKARAVALSTPGALVIGSDQVADCNGRMLGKPGTIDNARAQLRACSGRTVTFHTAVCLVDTRLGRQDERSAIDATRVVFRSLSEAEIVRYADRERPFDCAGSFKSEGLGIGLFERVESSDPTALIGLPLIALCRLLLT